MEPEGHPGHQVTVLDRPVGRRPPGQPVPPGAPGREIPRREQFILVIRRHPEHLVHEPGPLEHPVLRIEQGHRPMVHRHLVAHRIAGHPHHRRVDEPPDLRLVHGVHQLALPLGPGHAGLCPPDTPARVDHRLALHLEPLHHQRVVLPIHVQVHPERQEVAVVHRHQVGRDVPAIPVAPLAVLLGLRRHHLHNAGGADIHPDRAVLHEGPVEDVVVVAGMGDHPEHQVAPESRLRLAEGEPVSPGRLAPDPLEQASHPGLGPWLAPRARHQAVHHHRVGRAVHPRLERAVHPIERPGIRPQVKVGRVTPTLRRLLVRHQQLGQRTLVHDGPLPPTVQVLDQRHHQAAPHVGPEMEPPWAPAHQPAFDGEVRPLRLGNDQRFHRRAPGAHRLDVPVARITAERHHALVNHPNHLPLGQVDDRHQPRHRRAVAGDRPVAVRALAPDNPAALLFRPAHVAVGRGEAGEP